MRIIASSIFRKWSFYGSMIFSFALLISFQNCGKVRFSTINNTSVGIPSCGSIKMTPANGLREDDAITFEVISPVAGTISNINWDFIKNTTPLFSSTLNPVTHTFNGVGEGAGEYEANVSFLKSDGDNCILAASFQILSGDFCQNPTGISGPATGFVGEETSDFTINFEDCFVGSVTWDMNSDGVVDFYAPDGSLERPTVNSPVSFTYPAAGTYTVKAVVNNDEADSQATLTRRIVISNKSCINPFNNQIIPHGGTVEFAKTNPACGSACLKSNKTCNNGIFEGDQTYTQNPATCAISATCACPNGAINPPTCTRFAGACGTVHTTSVSTLTNSSANICVANNVTPAAPFVFNPANNRYEWSCTGLGGGTVVSNCYANKTYTGTWTANAAPACTTTCGYAGGIQTGTVTCSNSDCNPLTKPQPLTRTCPATAACYTGVWTANPAAACTTACGYDGGTLTGTVTCSNTNCNPATKPAALIRTCSATAACPCANDATNPPQCDRYNGACGSVNTTTVSSLTGTSPNVCGANNVSPATSFIYNPTLHRYQWSCTGNGGGTVASGCYANKTYTGTWTANPAPACTTACGYPGGTLTGTVTCSDSDCDPSTKPQPLTRTCAPTNQCYTGVWAVTAPAPCTTTCGYSGGTQYGSVICSNNNCDPATKPAVPVSYCPATPACYTGTWTANPAPACPTACGYVGGTLIGTVTCSNTSCDPATKPAAQTRSCSATPACTCEVRYPGDSTTYEIAIGTVDTRYAKTSTCGQACTQSSFTCTAAFAATANAYQFPTGYTYTSAGTCDTANICPRPPAVRYCTFGSQNFSWSGNGKTCSGFLASYGFFIVAEGSGYWIGNIEGMDIMAGTNPWPGGGMANCDATAISKGVAMGPMVNGIQSFGAGLSFDPTQAVCNAPVTLPSWLTSPFVTSPLPHGCGGNLDQIPDKCKAAYDATPKVNEPIGTKSFVSMAENHCVVLNNSGTPGVTSTPFAIGCMNRTGPPTTSSSSITW